MIPSRSCFFAVSGLGLALLGAPACGGSGGDAEYPDSEEADEESSDDEEYSSDDDAQQQSAPSRPQEREVTKVNLSQEGEWLVARTYVLKECMNDDDEWVECGRRPAPGENVAAILPGFPGDLIGTTGEDGKVGWALTLSEAEIKSIKFVVAEGWSACRPTQSVFPGKCQISETIESPEWTAAKSRSSFAARDVMERVFADPCKERGLTVADFSAEQLKCDNDGDGRSPDWHCSMNRTVTCRDNEGLPSQLDTVQILHVNKEPIESVERELAQAVGVCELLARQTFDGGRGWLSFGGAAWKCR
jgi:hypothetical protein